MNLPDYHHHFPITSVVVLLLGAVLAAVLLRHKKLRNIFIFLALSLSLACHMALIGPVMQNGEIIVSRFAFLRFEADALSLFFCLLTVVTASVTAVYSIQCKDDDEKPSRYYVLLLLFTLGAVTSMLSADFLMISGLMEALCLAVSLVRLFRKNAPGSEKAGIKKLSAGCIGSAFILAGTFILYAQTRTFDLAQLAALIPGNMNNAAKLALALLFTGFVTKVFFAPFFPGIMTEYGVCGMIRITFFLCGTADFSPFRFLMVFAGSVGMLASASAAFSQYDLKRTLTLYLLSQTGCVLTALGLGTGLGVSAGLYHALSSVLCMGLLFLAAGAVAAETGTAAPDGLGGLSKKMPKTMALFIVGGASLCFLPPFSGFVSGWMICQAAYRKAAESGNLWYFLVAVIAVMTSVLTLASFIRIMQSAFFGRLPESINEVHEAKPLVTAVMCILAFLCLLTGLFPEFVAEKLTEPAAYALFDVPRYIDTALGSGYASRTMGEKLPVNTSISFNAVGYWAPIQWLLIFGIGFIAVAIIALCLRYDNVREAEDGGVDSDSVCGPESAREDD